MRTEQQQLHDAYGKHELGPKLYRNKTDPHTNWPALTQCPCGDWHVYNTAAGAWEPLMGHVAAGFINQNPELYPILKAWWPDMPHPSQPTPVPWEGIDFNVDPGIRAFYNPAAKINPEASGDQNPASEQDLLTKMFMPLATPPSEYNNLDTLGAPDSWRTVTISTTDNTAGQNIISPNGTPIAPPNVHNLWGLLKDKP